MDLEDLGSAFEPMLGEPSWLARKGVGSMITMEFGEPSVEVDEPRPSSFFFEDGSTSLMTMRHSAVRGQWHLWIYHCNWTITSGEHELATSDNSTSDIMIARALGVLNGQSLSSVAASSNASTIFEFDLNCRLVTTPRSKRSGQVEEAVEQWMFFQPNGNVLTLKSDGTVEEEERFDDG